MSLIMDINWNTLFLCIFKTLQIFAQETSDINKYGDDTCFKSYFTAIAENQNTVIRRLENQAAMNNLIDCYDILRQGYTRSGEYFISTGHFSIEHQKRVFCEMDIDGGGWTVVQRRMDGSESFTRNWEDFKNGFGNVSREFWIGNKYLYGLTKNRNYRVRFDLEDWDGNWRYAEYSYMYVQSERDNFELQIGSYTGNAGDSFSVHGNTEFSTIDRNNDRWSSGNCINHYGYGGFWLNACMSVGINNGYSSSSSGYVGTTPNRIRWDGWHGSTYSLKYTSMMIRPID